MYAQLGSLLAIGFGAVSVHNDALVNEMFKTWQQAQRETRSLVVEFSTKQLDDITSKETERNGELRLLRTEAGDLLASYHLDGGKLDQSESWLLVNSTAYLRDHKKKLATKFELKEGDLTKELASKFNLIIALMRRELIEERFKLEITKEDEWYTYVKLTPTESARKKDGWWGDQSIVHAAFLKQKAERIPKYFLRSMAVDNFGEHMVYDFKSWQLNPANPPKQDEFLKPDERQGWQIRDWSAFPPAPPWVTEALEKKQKEKK